VPARFLHGHRAAHRYPPLVWNRQNMGQFTRLSTLMIAPTTDPAASWWNGQREKTPQPPLE